jgi:hypothetical protein
MDSREEQNKAAAEHVARLRKSLEDGKAEIERQQALISDTREHMAGMQRFLEERDRSDEGDAAA